MMFIDGPSVLAPVEKWEAYLIRLNALNPRDETVISEKERAARIIKILLEDSDHLLEDYNIPP